ncbi:MAG: acyl-[acyl-carrier-protein]--UDP-N-acetylglucosamine O-acyltransferase [Robiginitomaculum sp.]|nr:MAG: acyl-[acyl-carrier-protein]--UDP-N-acetylglucosamine O-acyltransferase [Robiginitomaculum sp.]
MSETSIHPLALVEPGAHLGGGVQIGPFSIVKAGAVLGDGVVVHGQVCIGASVSIGQDCEIFPQAVLGMSPQDVKYKGEETRLVIGARNIIREHVTMHPGTAVGNGETRIGDDGYFMVGAHIGHDCSVGDHVVLSNGVAIGGYVKVGDYANLGGLVGVHQFTRIGHRAFIGAQVYVSCDVIPYAMVTGNPGHLNGLNVIGLQRAGMARRDIQDIRKAYKAIFERKGDLFDDRLAEVEREFSENANVMRMIRFIKARALRPLCLPDGH